MKKRFKIGDEVLINEDNEQYGDAFGKILIVEKISTNTKEHPGYDSGIGEALYDLKFKNGKQFNSSLYDYELRHAKMKHGAKIKSHIYKRGTKIEKYDKHTTQLEQANIRRDYTTKNDPDFIWDNWTIEQREHFLEDHEQEVKYKNVKYYSDLPKEIKQKLKKHIERGRYEHGTKIESQHEKLEYENVVNELRENASIAKIDVKPYGVEIQPYSPIDDAYMLPIKLTRHELLALYIESDKQFNHDNETIIGSIESMTKLLLKK